MKLEPVGRVADISGVNFEPVTIPIVGYTRADDGEVIEVITDIDFVSSAPIGAILDVMRGSDENGEIDNAAVIAYLDACVDPASRGDMDDLLHSPTIRVTLTTLVDVYKALTVAYTGRPTSRRSESRERSLPTKATSTGAASSRASTRRASR